MKKGLIYWFYSLISLAISTLCFPFRASSAAPSGTPSFVAIPPRYPAITSNATVCLFINRFREFKSFWILYRASSLFRFMGYSFLQSFHYLLVFIKSIKNLFVRFIEVGHNLVYLFSVEICTTREKTRIFPCNYLHCFYYGIKHDFFGNVFRHLFTPRLFCLLDYFKKSHQLKASGHDKRLNRCKSV